MKRADQDKVLEELFASEDLTEARGRSLKAGLASMGRRRRNRRALGAGGGLITALALAVWMSLHRPHAPSPDPSVAATDGQQPAVEFADAGPAEAASRLRVITDEELLALFPDRSVALVGGPGEQQFLLVDDLP